MKSENVVWGGYSMVDVELKGIKELLAIGRDWDFLINLSGQDFPLKSQPFIQDYLSSKKGTEFINVLNQKKERPETMFRIQYIYFEFRNSMIRIPIRRQYLKGKTPYSGHQWFILTRDFCEFICQSSEVKELERFYRNTLIPDEGFFQSVLMNTSYNSIIENDNKRLIKWVPTKRGKSRPKILTLDDLGSLQASEAFFARKFDESVDSIIFDRMETKLLYS
jgi:hypothetical protein